MPQIEDRKGIDNAEEIMAVEGVDIGFLGPSDLSLDLGVELGSTVHEEAMAHLLAACQKAEKPCGLPVTSSHVLHQREKRGFTVFDLCSDLRLLEAVAKTELQAAKGS